MRILKKQTTPLTMLMFVLCVFGFVFIEMSVKTSAAEIEGSEKHEEISIQVEKVEIEWGDMEFIYTGGTWNPDTHIYEGGIWSPASENANLVTIKNVGDAAVTVRLSCELNSEFAEVSWIDNDGTNIQANSIEGEVGINESKIYKMNIGNMTMNGLQEPIEIGTLKVQLYSIKEGELSQN